MNLADVPIDHTSLSQLQICCEAFCAAPGLSCNLFRAINDHIFNAESEIAEGPFKFADESIDRMFSDTMEYSSKSASSTVLKSLQAALDVTEDEKARVARSTACGQYLFS